MKRGQQFGFVATEPRQSATEFQAQIGFLPGELKPVEGKSDIVIAAAAGLSNVIRISDAIENIALGKVTTDNIIIATCDRAVPQAERDRVAVKKDPSGHPFDVESAHTEYELMQKLFSTLTGAEFGEEELVDAGYGNGLKSKVRHAQIVINNEIKNVTIVSAPQDPSRPDPRVHTEETFIAAMPFVTHDADNIVIESHDAWVPYQQVIGDHVFGVDLGKKVIATGPFKSDRIFWREGNDEKFMDILDAQGVVDEMAKVNQDLMKLQVKIANKIASFELKTT